MKILLRHILTAALLGVIGCTSADSEKGRFDRIAKDLDMGGSSFFIGSSRHAGTAFEQLRKQHERYVWSSSFTPEAQYKLQRFISCSELAGRLVQTPDEAVSGGCWGNLASGPGRELGFGGKRKGAACRI